ncbi:hypothetical protein ES703_18449 [subsurface metagenome]
MLERIRYPVGGRIFGFKPVGNCGDVPDVFRVFWSGARAFKLYPHVLIKDRGVGLLKCNGTFHTYIKDPLHPDLYLFSILSLMGGRDLLRFSKPLIHLGS